jgi:hypothetical protein
MIPGWTKWQFDDSEKLKKKAGRLGERLEFKVTPNGVHYFVLWKPLAQDQGSITPRQYRHRARRNPLELTSRVVRKLLTFRERKRHPFCFLSHHREQKIQ